MSERFSKIFPVHAKLEDGATITSLEITQYRRATNDQPEECPAVLVEISYAGKGLECDYIEKVPISVNLPDGANLVSRPQDCLNADNFEFFIKPSDDTLELVESLERNGILRQTEDQVQGAGAALIVVGSLILPITTEPAKQELQDFVRLVMRRTSIGDLMLHAKAENMLKRLQR